MRPERAEPCHNKQSFGVLQGCSPCRLPSTLQNDRQPEAGCSLRLPGAQPGGHSVLAKIAFDLPVGDRSAVLVPFPLLAFQILIENVRPQGLFHDLARFQTSTAAGISPDVRSETVGAGI